MAKLPIITDTLERLAADLGVHAFVISDNWKDDHTATAITSRQDTSQQVYFCQSGSEDNTLFDYELETAPVNARERLYDVVGTGSGVMYEELREIARKHLDVASPNNASR